MSEIAADLAPPVWLTERQRVVWFACLARIPEANRGAIDPSLWVEWIVAQEAHSAALEKQAQIDHNSSTPMLTKGAGGRPVPSPYLAVAAQAAARMRRAAADLNISVLMQPGAAGDISPAGDDAAPVALSYVSKGELADLLRCSKPTIDVLIKRYPDFPIVSRGSNGIAWQFDPVAVIEFVRQRRAVEAASAVERDDMLAQLALPGLAGGDEPDAPISQREIGLALDNEGKRQKLRIARGELVSADDVAAALRAAFADLGIRLDTAVRQVAAEHHLPEPVATSLAARAAAARDAAIRATQEFLRADVPVTEDDQPAPA